MSAETKYKKKFAKQLLNGMRSDGKSQEEVSRIWGITRGTYNAWRKAHPEFEHAHEIGEMDKTSWWRQLQRKVGSGESPGNAAVINLALKNEAGYVDKQEVAHTHEEQITTIRIERIESPKPRIIEHERTQDLLDQQPS